MKKSVAIGLVFTFAIGLILSRIAPIQIGFRGDADRLMLYFWLILGITELYFTLVLWKYMIHRIWVKSIYIFFIIGLSPIVGLLITQFLIRPLLIHVPLLYWLIGKWEYNSNWFFALGVSIAVLLLYCVVKLFVKIIRGETIIF